MAADDEDQGGDVVSLSDEDEEETESDGILPVAIVDSGSGLIKGGFAGDDSPRVVFPAITGRLRKNAIKLTEQDVYCGDEALCFKTTITYPIDHGVVQDWDDMEMLWQHTFDNELRMDPQENTVLLSEPPMNPYANREKMCETMFEKFHCPAVYVANQSVLALYASARTTGMVVDCGDGVTHFSPIFEGYVQKHCAIRLDLAGRDITSEFQKMLIERGYNMKTTLEKELVKDCKEHICHVAKNYQAEESGPETLKEYKLPDGKIIEVGKERFKCTEILFSPHMIGVDRPGIHDLCYTSLSGCDMDVRGAMKENIVICGGTTMLPGFTDRLKRELNTLDSANVSTISIHATPERKYAVWIGGSIMASLGTFSEQCLTYDEYQEEGPSIVHKKFESSSAE